MTDEELTCLATLQHADLRISEIQRDSGLSRARTVIALDGLQDAALVNCDEQGWYSLSDSGAQALKPAEHHS